MISPDGTRILYEQGSAIWIRDLVAASPSRIQVFSRVIKYNQTMEPHWWIDPKTKEEYIQYTQGLIEDHEWPPQSGGTYVIKLDKDSHPLGVPILLMPFHMSAARSKNGVWGATSHHSTGMYKFNSNKIEAAFLNANNWLDTGVVLACNASIDPSNDPARQNRMMHLHSGGNAMGGKPYDNHKAVIIRSWTDVDPDHPLWWMGPLGDRCENDSSGNLFWGAPEWSTDEEYFTVTGTKDVEGVDTADLYIARINYTGDSRLLRVIKGEGKNVFSHLWVKDGVAPAKIRLDSTTLSFNAFRKDTLDPNPKLVLVSNSGDGTLPLLSLGPLPKWLKVTISGNGTNSVKLFNQVFRDSTVPGVYSVKVMIGYGRGADSANYTINFNYSDPVLTALKPVSAHAVLAVGDSILLTAVGLDQAGNPLPDPVAVTWSGVGTLSPKTDGWFYADSSAWRTYQVIGKSGTITCTTTVTVTHRLLRIDVGAIAGQATPGWSEDGDYALDGVVGNLLDTIKLPTLKDTAPKSLYHSWRRDFTGFRFPNLPNARYRVRMHLVGPSIVATGSLTVRFEGQKVLDAYHLPIPVDSGFRAVDIQEASVTVSDGNGLTLDASTTGTAPALAGLEIYDQGLPPVNLVTPNGGETYSVGDTLSIRWSADSAIASCGIQISVDSGVKWIPLTRKRSVSLIDPDWQNFHWVIPDSLDGFAMSTGRAMVSVYDYFGTDRDRSDRVFRILEKVSSIHASSPSLSQGLKGVHWEGNYLHLELVGRGNWKIFLTDIHGRKVRNFSFLGSGRLELDVGSLAGGVYRIQAVTEGQMQSRLLPYFP